MNRARELDGRQTPEAETADRRPTAARRVRIGSVPPTLEDTLRALAQAVEEAKFIRVELDEEYLRAIAAVEALAQNQSGADKTWVSCLDDAFREHYRRVKRA